VLAWSQPDAAPDDAASLFGSVFATGPYARAARSAAWDCSDYWFPAGCLQVSRQDRPSPTPAVGRVAKLTTPPRLESSRIREGGLAVCLVSSIAMSTAAHRRRPDKCGSHRHTRTC